MVPTGSEIFKESTSNLAQQSLRNCNESALHCSKAMQRSKHFSIAAYDNVGCLFGL